MTRGLSLFFAGIMVGLMLAVAAFSWLARNDDASSSSTQKLTLKMGHTLDASHPVHLAMVHFKEQLEAESGGTMTVEIYPSAVLGSEAECIEQLQNGSLDFTKTSAAPLEAFIEQMKVFGLPYAFRDEAHFWRVLDGPIGKRLLDLTSKSQLHGLCYYDSGSRNFYTRSVPVDSPNDLKGKKIRVQNSSVAIRMVEAFGGAATPIAFGELYSALAQGIVDGAENNVQSFVSSRHMEVCKYFSLNGHTRVPDVVMMSEASWQRLNPQQQAWVQNAAESSSKYQRELWAETTARDMKIIRDAGIHVIEPDLQPFIDQAQQVHRAFDGTVVGALLKEVQNTP